MVTKTFGEKGVLGVKIISEVNDDEIIDLT